MRDSDLADLADGGDGAAWFAALEAGRWDEDVPPAPAVPPPEILPVVGDLTALTAPEHKVSKAERRKANRALAAQVRGLGMVPNGVVWERAKALYAAGVPINAETMEETA